MRLRSGGRGRDYSLARGVVEETLRRLYVDGWPARLWSRVPGACRVDTVHVSVPAPLARPVRVAFASDLHLGPTTPRALLDDAFARLAEARPDVLALGGDYVFLDATDEKAQELAARIASVPAALKVAVLGNHDLWTEHALIEHALSDAGVRVLVNDSVRFGDLALVGVDDPWTGTMDAERALDGAGDARCVLAVSHAPEAIPELADRVDALLCGHTHGGHVALPGGIPLVIPGPQGKRFPHGVHRVGRCTAIVSRGVGGIEVPFRVFARPDVVILDLVPKHAAAEPAGDPTAC